MFRADRQVRAGLLTSLVLCAVFCVALGTAYPRLLEQAAPYGAAVPAALTAALLLVTVAQHAPPRARRRPHRRLLLLAAQAVLTYIPLLVLGEPWLSVLGFLLGAALAQLPRPLSLYAAAGVAASGPLIIVLLPVDNRLGFRVALDTLLVGLVVHGIVRLSRLTSQAQADRTRTAARAVQYERDRVARDLHDLLGAQLSAVALRAQAAEAAAHDPDAVRRELAEIQQLARTALADVRGVARGRIALALDDELARARAVLTGAGVDAEVTGPATPPPPDLSGVLGAALREGVTNVLRHSDARHCAVTVGQEAGAVRLVIVNDGVRAGGPDPYGSGLPGLTARAEERGGRLTAGTDADGRFRLTVTLPA
ncbi:two-component sensor histidine kinase [Streptomyces sp. AV19]|uniref:sensor histidine kinase n=1 Tax=Streptomyces sp. AV19 TaxID=2793068 RepID=UPI0018FF03DB|nr:histidine kinase [Streptomyces sp. AV19]MBH1936406.1 two-component sensor histidine kinase [Streptomyces sp. AV19]MDG4532445.1 histidine kinase [Streptomyces sp. AV19]